MIAQQVEDAFASVSVTRVVVSMRMVGGMVVEQQPAGMWEPHICSAPQCSSGQLTPEEVLAAALVEAIFGGYDGAGRLERSAACT